MLSNSKIKIFTASVLAMGIFGIGLNSLAMDHSARGHESCGAAIAQGTDCSAPQGNEACLDYHLGILNKLSQAVPNEGKLALLALVLLPIFLWFIQKFPLLFRHFLDTRIRMKWLWEDLAYSFSKQLWFLTLQGKRDPSFAFL